MVVVVAVEQLPPSELLIQSTDHSSSLPFGYQHIEMQLGKWTRCRRIGRDWCAVRGRVVPFRADVEENQLDIFTII